LVQKGQLNIVNGGLAAPDEACTNYDDIIDNFMSGHRFLKENVGISQPTVGWQVDSFGVSSGYARLVKDIGVDAMFFGRVDVEEK
jgi:alpha-mannosidase